MLVITGQTFASLIGVDEFDWRVVLAVIFVGVILLFFVTKKEVLQIRVSDLQNNFFVVYQSRPALLDLPVLDLSVPLDWQLREVRGRVVAAQLHELQVHRVHADIRIQLLLPAHVLHCV